MVAPGGSKPPKKPAAPPAAATAKHPAASAAGKSGPMKKPAAPPAAKTAAPRPQSTQGIAGKTKPAARPDSKSLDLKKQGKPSGPASSSLNLRVQKKESDSSFRLLARAGVGGSGGATTSIEPGLVLGRRRGHEETLHPGPFRLWVKFTIAIAIAIAMVIGLVGYLIQQKSREVIIEEVDRGGVKLVKALGCIHSEYYDSLAASWSVDDYRSLEKYYRDITIPTVNNFTKDADGTKGLSPEAYRTNAKQLAEATQWDKRKREWKTWLQRFQVYVPNDETSVERQKSDIEDVLIYITSKRSEDPEPSDEAIVADTNLRWSFDMDRGALVSLDNAHWLPYTVRIKGVDTPVDEIYLFDTHVGASSCRAFRSAIRNADGAKVGSVIVFVSHQKIEEAGGALLEDVIHYSYVGAGIGVLVAILLAMAVTRPIKRLIKDVNEVAQGNMDHRASGYGADEIGLLAGAFNNMTRSLKTAIKDTLDANKREQEQKHELNIATEIQTKLLPDSIPAISGYDLHAFYRPSKDVGGDYYDFLVVDPTHHGIIVADVSGKGIPGALVMTMARSLIRLAAGGQLSAAAAMRQVNGIISQDIRRGMFVTAIYGILDVTQRRMSLVSAGHNPALWYRAATGKVDRVNPKGMALGFDKGAIFNRIIEETVLDLRPGDRIVLYTDGVTEAMNDRHEQFGEDTLMNYLQSHQAQSSTDFVQGLVVELEKHRGKAPQHDDITIVTFRVQ